MWHSLFSDFKVKSLYSNSRHKAWRIRQDFWRTFGFGGQNVALIVNRVGVERDKANAIFSGF